MDKLLNILTEFEHGHLCHEYECSFNCPIGKDLCDDIGAVYKKIVDKIGITETTKDKE